MKKSKTSKEPTGNQPGDNYHGPSLEDSKFITFDVSKIFSRLLPRPVTSEEKAESSAPKRTFDQLFPDREGTLGPLLNTMQINTKEKNRWLKVWLELTNGGDYKLTKDEFEKQFKLGGSLWVDRLFDIINYNLSGKVTFEEFLSFCNSYILIDKFKTVELCFRLLSRRGTNFMEKFSILDVDDMKTFLSERYTINGIGKLKRRAQDVITSVALTAAVKKVDGAILLKDFIKFCHLNPVFVRFTHRIQTHIRHCLFGMPYWIDRSRKIKALAAGSMFMMMTSGSNIASERFIAEKLTCPESDVDENDRKKTIEKQLREKSQKNPSQKNQSSNTNSMDDHATSSQLHDETNSSRDLGPSVKNSKKSQSQQRGGEGDRDKSNIIIFDNGPLNTSK